MSHCQVLDLTSLSVESDGLGDWLSHPHLKSQRTYWLVRISPGTKDPHRFLYDRWLNRHLLHDIFSLYYFPEEHFSMTQVYSCIIFGDINVHFHHVFLQKLHIEVIYSVLK